MRRLNSKIQEYCSAVDERQSDIVKKQENIEISKQDILKIKH
jgi:peptidoglycan hydrolase CwlO-like protein